MITSPTGHVYLSYRHVYTEPLRLQPAPKQTVMQDESDFDAEKATSKLRAAKSFLTGIGPSSAHSDDDSGPPPF